MTPDPYNVLPVNYPLRAGQVGPQPNFGVNQNGGLQFKRLEFGISEYFGDPIPLGSILP